MKSVKPFSRDAMTTENRGSFIYIYIDRDPLTLRKQGRFSEGLKVWLDSRMCVAKWDFSG